jgi:membrane-associated phospholipid phosphatase
MAVKRGLARRRAVAATATYLLEPKNWIIATVIGVGWRYGGPGGLAWGLVAALFAAILPTVFITRGVRSGRWADRNVGARGPRLMVLGFILASVALGLLVLATGGAPPQLTWYFGGMLASVAVLAAITAAWKISIHCAVASGAVTVLALLYGLWVMPAYLLVAVTAWSRVELRDHTPAQVVAGTILGVAAAAASYALMRLPGSAVTWSTAGRCHRRSRWQAACRRVRTRRSSPRWSGR